MCEEYNYCPEKKEHRFSERQGYKGDVCPHCFSELQDEVITLRKKILELDETIYFLNEKFIKTLDDTK